MGHSPIGVNLLQIGFIEYREQQDELRGSVLSGRLAHVQDVVAQPGEETGEGDPQDGLSEGEGRQLDEHPGTGRHGRQLGFCLLGLGR